MCNISSPIDTTGYLIPKEKARSPTVMSADRLSWSTGSVGIVIMKK